MLNKMNEMDYVDDINGTAFGLWGQQQDHLTT